MHRWVRDVGTVLDGAVPAPGDRVEGGERVGSLPPPVARRTAQGGDHGVDPDNEVRVERATLRTGNVVPLVGRGMARRAPGPAPGLARDTVGVPARVPVRFSTTVLLTKAEVFAACQALADADRELHRRGSPQVSEALGDLFELLERRLVDRRPRGSLQASDGRNSRESELTQ